MPGIQGGLSQWSPGEQRESRKETEVEKGHGFSLTCCPRQKVVLS